MRASTSPRGTRRTALALGCLATIPLWTAAAPVALAADAPPTACGGPTLTDPAGDGHHPNTDVLSAWLTESGGRLQAVIQVHTASWAPAHDDSDAASFAVLFRTGEQTRFVRAQAPRTGPVQFDAGTWAGGGAFVTTATTTGSTTPGTGGAVTIDVPSSIAAGATVLASPSVLTWDGATDGDPHWVDAAPGGTTPATAGAGADYVLGSCRPAGQPTLPTPDGPVPPAEQPALTAVQLSAPSRRTGAGRTKLAGMVTPGRAGVVVSIAATTRLGARTLAATTNADGTFSLSPSVQERTTWRATAGGLGSQTLTTRVVAKVTATVRRTKSGAAVVTGTVSPALPGRVLWLRTNQVSPSGTATPRKGRFSLQIKRPSAGRYQALFIPSKARAERGLSTRKTIR